MSEEDARSSWQDAVIAERMSTDRDFQDRLFDASLSNQSWELVMTAASLEIERPTDPDQARLVANMDRLENVLPAIRDIESRNDPQGGGSGFIDRLLGAIGLGRGNGQSYRAEAERLATEYAKAFQETLEERGKWEMVCELAAADDT